jgi:cytochrome c peroxidase
MSTFRFVSLVGAILPLCVSGCRSSQPGSSSGTREGLGLTQLAGAAINVLGPIRGLDLLVPVPADNPLTNEKIVLGTRLFFDPALSADGAVSCASCHRPDRAFSDSVAVSRGVFGRHGLRNAPVLVNRAYGRAFFWDGRVETLEEQVLHPIQDSLELGQPLPKLVRQLDADRSYRADFERAFSEPISASAIGRALSSYVRTLRSGDAPIDRWRDGNASSLSNEARRGLALFTGRANCISCHVGPNFTDEDFHNTGVAARSARYAAFDSGRSRVTGNLQDVGAFKTPTLREVARTAPYMHDGSFPTLESVVAFYDNGGIANAHLDAEIKPLGLTLEQRRDLVAFLEALTGTMSGGPQRFHGPVSKGGGLRR